eukprot:489333-Pelagomonas_calceolata.AAC.4
MIAFMYDLFIRSVTVPTTSATHHSPTAQKYHCAHNLYQPSHTYCCWQAPPFPPPQPPTTHLLLLRSTSVPTTRAASVELLPRNNKMPMSWKVGVALSTSTALRMPTRKSAASAAIHREWRIMCMHYQQEHAESGSGCGHL